jgi:predicted pyridoxine 5'-phosphate oxidase superfamily flavin-nucleotide-binding protein
VSAVPADPRPLASISACFEGIIPAVIATAAADGTPNVTHLTRVHLVDDERVALSNQFFSKTVRNLTENPRACVLLIDPLTFDEYRLVLRYERTERRGPIFDRLHRDVEAVAALTGMQGIFTLKSADIYRVVELDCITPGARDEALDADTERS